MTYATRFAPSPTGPLHIGHAYSVLVAQARADAAGGLWHLRIEDTDRERSKDHWVAAIEEDLAWLGLNWPTPVLRQSDHFLRYDAHVARLIDKGLVYPCSCSRGDIAAAVTAPQEGATYGPIYPGTCRGRSMDSRLPGDTLRLDMSRATAGLGALAFDETGPARAGHHDVTPDTLITGAGDIVLTRRGTGDVAYFVASAIDDAYQSITEVVRGEDLFEFTPVQVLLLNLFELPVPAYHHHRLIRDEAGRRLAKRDNARSIATLRADGHSPDDIRAMVGL